MDPCPLPSCRDWDSEFFELGIFVWWKIWQSISIKLNYQLHFHKFLILCHYLRILFFSKQIDISGKGKTGKTIISKSLQRSNAFLIIFIIPLVKILTLLLLLRSLFQKKLKLIIFVFWILFSEILIKFSTKVPCCISNRFVLGEEFFYCSLWDSNSNKLTSPSSHPHE